MVLTFTGAFNTYGPLVSLTFTCGSKCVAFFLYLLVGQIVCVVLFVDFYKVIAKEDHVVGIN